MKNIKLLLTLLLVFALILSVCSCSYPPSETPPEEVPGEEIEGDGTGDKDNTGTPEDGNNSGSTDFGDGENTTPGGENEGENTPGGDDNTGDDTPDNNQPDNGEDTQPPTDNNQDENEGDETTLAAYLQKIKDELDIMGLVNLSEQEQQIFVASFNPQSEFFDWYFAALAKYKEEHPGVDLEGGDFDLFG